MNWIRIRSVDDMPPFDGIFENTSREVLLGWLHTEVMDIGYRSGDVFMSVQGIITRNGIYPNKGGIYPPPTHWMPLPPRPTEE